MRSQPVMAPAATLDCALCRREFLERAGLLVASLVAGPSLTGLSAASNASVQADAEPLQLVGEVSTGWVKALALDPFADRVFAPRQGGGILAVDGATLGVTTLGDGVLPPSYGIACDRFRRRVLMASEQWPPELISFTLPTGAIDRIALPGIAPQFGSIAVSPSLRRVYAWLHDVPTRAGRRTGVAAIDYVGGRIAGFVPLDAFGFSMGLTINPSTRRVYAWAESEQVVHAIDATSNLRHATIDIPFPVQHVAIDRATDRVFVVCESGPLLVLDGESHEAIAKVQIDLGLSVVAAVDAGRNHVYLAGGTPLQLVRLDGTSYSVLDSLELGSDHVPFALAISEATSRIYTGDADVIASPWEPFSGRIVAAQA